MRTLVGHVSLRCFVLEFGFKGNGESENASGNFGGAEISELRFQNLEVMDKVRAWESDAIVVKQKSSAASNGVVKIGSDVVRCLSGS